MKTIKLNVIGMHCGGCKMAIETALNQLEGVKEARVSLEKNQVQVTFDESLLKQSTIEVAIKDSGYEVAEQPAVSNKEGGAASTSSSKPSKVPNLVIWVGLCLLAMAVVFFSPIALPALGTIPAGVGFGALFGIGLVTSVHCVGMCGGINLSVTLRSNMGQKPWVPSALYNLGRMTSYTIIGGILGAASGMLSIAMPFKVTIALLAGTLVFLMGLKQIGLLDNFALPNLLPKPLYNIIARLNKHHSGPYIVGLLNGLMPCGPLQVMQLYALTTGSWIAGATAMFAFSLGTIPLMFTFGLTANLLGKRFNKTLTRVSGVFMIILAAIAIQRGLVLANWTPENLMKTINTPVTNVETLETSSGIKAVLIDDYQEVRINVTRSGYQDIIVQKDIPVRFILIAGQNDLTSCNEAISIPAFNIQAGLMPGETIVEFTPTEVGELPYSCWMGMINNTIYVVETLE